MLLLSFCGLFLLPSNRTRLPRCQNEEFTDRTDEDTEEDRSNTLSRRRQRAHNQNSQMGAETSRRSEGDDFVQNRVKPQNNIRVVKIPKVDGQRIYLPAKLTVILPDGSFEQEARLVNRDTYAFTLSDDDVAARFDSGQLKPDIQWPSSDSGSNHHVLVPKAIYLVKS